jgi:glycosyltransferase involved in cell wall biosynthesis
MNILISSCTHWWNAEAHYAAVLCKVLREAGHGAWIITQPDTRNATELELRGLAPITDIAVWTGNPLHWPRILHELRELQGKLRIDVVDVFRSRELLPHLLAARRAGIAVVRTRGTAQGVRGHPINRWLYGSACQGVIASAEAQRRELLGRLQLPPDRVRTIYYPAEPPEELGEAARLAADPEARHFERERLFAEFGWEPARKLICIVGRASPEKGHAELIDALALLVRLMPDAVLAIADKRYEDEAPYRAELERRVLKAGLAAHVRWLGFRPDVRRIMACADVGVIPSLSSEMNCRVAVEFFSVGTPVVAFATGALPEVVVEGVSGIIVPERAAEALTGTLHLLLGDEDLRERLAAGAHAAARRRFSREGFLAQTLSVFAAARHLAARG